VNNISTEVKTDFTPLYSTLTFAAAAALGTQQEFFRTTRSSEGPEKTNMRREGELIAPERFDVFGLRFLFNNTEPVEVENIISKYAVQLEIGGVVRWEGPMKMFPGGGGMQLSTATAATSGIADPRAVFAIPFDRPDLSLAIEAGDDFVVRLVSKAGYTLTAAKTAEITAVLEGLYTRPQR